MIDVQEKPYLVYAGIGARNTPEPILKIMHHVACYLYAEGWILPKILPSPAFGGTNLGAGCRLIRTERIRSTWVREKPLHPISQLPQPGRPTKNLFWLLGRGFNNFAHSELQFRAEFRSHPRSNPVPHTSIRPGTSALRRQS